jgi:hypothetical protein
VRRWVGRGQCVDAALLPTIGLEHAALVLSLKANAKAMHYWMERDDADKAAASARECYRRIRLVMEIAERAKP